ncbi:phage major capsid protein [Miltoncostaea marina]|uniref:phage major capsid protein n=1 Tax=Miltoncostaea marina TaxID=2843215 RepID=UPI001C3D8E6E|nr:phage major capsid protein [Miltoncostaea marina]
MTLRERLRRAEQRLASLRDQRATAREALATARQAFEAAGEDAGTDHPTFLTAQEASEELDRISGELEAAEREQVALLRLAASEQDGDGPGAGDGSDRIEDVERYSREGLRGHANVILRRAGEVARGEAAQRLAAIAHGRTPIGRTSLGPAGTREELAAELDRADLAGLMQPDRRGLIEPTLRPLTFLDFLPFAGTDSNMVQYVRATTLPSDGAAVAPTAEGALKPEMNPLVFEDEDAPIRTIAAWTKQKKQVLADAPFLEGLLRTLLVYEVRRSLLGQLIAGDGTGENVLGLLNFPDVLTYARGTVDAGENIADAVLQGIVEVQDHDREPEVVLLNPRDIARIRLMRDDSGATAGTGGYLFGPPSQQGAATIWGYPMVAERSLPVGTALVADPAGALGLLRSGVEVLVSDSDQDDFIRNRITLLAELRAGLAVLRPDAFCKVTITEPVAP